MSAYAPVLQFWFGDSENDVECARRMSSLWWRKDADTDRDIAAHFGELREAVIRSRAAAWLEQPRGRLAAIVLIDQFSRNIHRGSPEAFAHDQLAQQLCLDGLEGAEDRSLAGIERAFFYMPLQHAESRELQRLSLRKFTELADEAPAGSRETFEQFRSYASQHRAIVERFGRFPHRNAVLGRPSTREELEFLEQPGSSF